MKLAKPGVLGQEPFDEDDESKIIHVDKKKEYSSMTDGMVSRFKPRGDFEDVYQSYNDKATGASPERIHL